jgi:hypothetical protein
LQDRESLLLLPRCFAVPEHFHGYLRQASPGPSLARAVPTMITRDLLKFWKVGRVR